jgi:hypothetical protein
LEIAPSCGRQIEDAIMRLIIASDSYRNCQRRFVETKRGPGEFDQESVPVLCVPRGVCIETVQMPKPKVEGKHTLFGEDIGEGRRGNGRDEVRACPYRSCHMLRII